MATLDSLIVETPDRVIARFVAARQGQPPTWAWQEPYNAIGLVRDGYLIAGVLYTNGEARNTCMHVGAINGKRWLTRAFLFACFDYPFNQLGKRRVTALVRRSNHVARGFVRGLGFALEGKMGHYFDDDDMLVFGLKKADCRWLQLAPRKRTEVYLEAA